MDEGLDEEVIYAGSPLAEYLAQCQQLEEVSEGGLHFFDHETVKPKEETQNGQRNRLAQLVSWATNVFDYSRPTRVQLCEYAIVVHTSEIAASDGADAADDTAALHATVAAAADRAALPLARLMPAAAMLALGVAGLISSTLPMARSSLPSAVPQAAAVAVVAAALGVPWLVRTTRHRRALGGLRRLGTAHHCG